LHLINFLIKVTFVKGGKRVESFASEPKAECFASEPKAECFASEPKAECLESGHGAVDHGAEMLACLRAAGLKLTPQRMAIVRELAADPTHPTAQELFERLRPALPTTSFATVYNTLDALASAGLCASLSLSPGPARFDPNMRPHHHAVCDACGLVRDIPCDAPPEPTRAGSAEPPGFEIRVVELIYRGLCAECARSAEGAPKAHGKRGATRAAD
jgi:Fur family peroxide stress response transcriptional regulator